MITLNLELPHGGGTRTVKVKSAEELTLADWKALTPITTDLKADPLDASYNAVEYFTGISQVDLDKFPIKGVRQIIDFIGEQLVKAQDGSKKFQKAVEEDNDFTPPKKLKIAEKKFIVPHDLDRDMVWGQWVDWAAWTQPEHEADLVAEVLLFCLVEEGQEYGPFGEEKTSLIWQCPMMTAFELCAFFFAKSDEFRSITNQRSSHFLMWTRHMLSMALKISPASTEELISSLKPQGSTLS